MRTKLKLVLVLASLGALAALALSSTASAGVTAAAADPMNTNVPYVAWAGEEIRLVKCIEDEGHAYEGVDAEWGIVDSSVRHARDLRDPVFFADTDRRTAGFAGAGERADSTCWAIDVDSVNPGMTRIKMALVDCVLPAGLPVVKHDFLVIWLNMSAPVLTELGDTAFPGLGVGDPLGDGNFAPSGGAYENGLIRAQVTGSFTDLLGTARTLPADWAALAGSFAFDTSGYNPNAWDIHDDQAATEGHTATSMCGGVAAHRRSGQLPRRRRDRCLLAADRRHQPDRRLRSTRLARAARTCRTASSTRVTRRCRPPGSTSTWRAPSVRWPRLTSTCSTAATGPALPRLRSRTTRTTCTHRSTSRTSRPRGRAWLDRRPASLGRWRTTSPATRNAGPVPLLEPPQHDVAQWLQRVP